MSDGCIFENGFPLMCFWKWSLSGFIWWSRSLCLVLGLSARWNSAHGWFMFSLLECSCPFQRQRLTELLDRLPLPCITWPSCKPTRPRRWSSCTRAVLTQVWCRSCARWWTLPFGQRKSWRSPLVRRCPLWWSKSATYGWTWQIWGNRTSTASWTPRSPRQASSVTRWRAWLRLPPHRSGRRWSDKKAFPGGPMLSPPRHRLYVVMEKLWLPFISLVQTDSKS